MSSHISPSSTPHCQSNWTVSLGCLLTSHHQAHPTTNQTGQCHWDVFSHLTIKHTPLPIKLESVIGMSSHISPSSTPHYQSNLRVSLGCLLTSHHQAHPTTNQTHHQANPTTKLECHWDVFSHLTIKQTPLSYQTFFFLFFLTRFFITRDPILKHNLGKQFSIKIITEQKKYTY